MAQATATISINDGLATPVARTFTCVKASPELTKYLDKRLAKMSYWPEVTLSADVPTANQRARKFELRVRKPVVNVVTGLVDDTGMIRIVGDIPQTMAQAEVDDLYAFAMNAAQQVLIKGACKDMDVIIG